MIFFIFSVVLMIVLGVLLDHTKSEKIDLKKIYCIICGFILVFIAGTRAPSVDFGDDRMYASNYELVSNSDYDEIYSYFTAQDTEVVFYGFAKTISNISKNYNFLLLICSIPVVLIVARFIYRKSRYPMLSFLIFACAFFFLWSIVVLRQALALAFILLAIDCLMEKKRVWFTVFVLLAFLFHRTAIITFLLLPLSFVKEYHKNVLLVFIISCAVILLFGGAIINFIMSLFQGMQHYSAYIARDESYGSFQQINKIVVYGLMTFAALFISDNKFKRKNALLIYSCMIGCLLCAFAPFFAESFRLGLYFMLPIITLLPNAIAESRDKRVKILLNGSLIVSLIALGIFTFNSMGYESLLLR